MGHDEDEQPLVDLELLSHFEASEEERIDRERDLDDDHEERRAALENEWASLDGVFGHREAA